MQKRQIAKSDQHAKGNQEYKQKRIIEKSKKRTIFAEKQNFMSCKQEIHHQHAYK